MFLLFSFLPFLFLLVGKKFQQIQQASADFLRARIRETRRSSRNQPDICGLFFYHKCDNCITKEPDPVLVKDTLRQKYIHQTKLRTQRDSCLDSTQRVSRETSLISKTCGSESDTIKAQMGETLIKDPLHTLAKNAINISKALGERNVIIRILFRRLHARILL